MDKIYVVYWSQSGNTQAMAEAVGAGITAAGKEAAVVDVSSVSTAELKNAKAFALGTPGSPFHSGSMQPRRVPERPPRSNFLAARFCRAPWAAAGIF